MKHNLAATDISIIIPTFNRLWSLPQTLASCRGNRCNVELIVIDDGSTDGTLEWLLKQPDVQLIKQAHLGKCWAVNAGFKIAKGKYVRFLDSDDLLDKLANDEQFALAEENNADIVVSGYKLFKTENIYTKTQPWIENDDFIAQQLGECDSSHYSAYLFKNEFIKDIPHRPDFALRDDRLFVLEAALKNPAITVHHGTAVLHRVDHEDRLQVNSALKQDVQHFQYLSIYKNILSKLQEEGRINKRRSDAAIKALWPLCTWIGQTHLRDAKDLYKWIIQLNPDFKIPANGFTGFLYKSLGFQLTQKVFRIGRFIKYGWR